MRSQFIRHNRTACSLLALATALAVGPSPAAAQVAGNGTFAVGSGTITPGTGSVTVGTPRAVINWNATGTVVGGVNEFLAPSNTLTFTGTGNFAVLNRVSTGTDMLGLNGTVNAGQGSIYFYNPNGIVVGGNAAFNVGSLVLTTLDITDSNFASGSTTINFAQASNPLSLVTVSSGAQINALQTDSYVAMVAPRVVHNGTITTNGQAALVGAEAATINFSPDGLFDITVDAGTTDANGVVIGGSIGGAQSAGLGDYNRIYAVAVPKNQALTMAITAGASLGFNVAGAADVDGNAIVLSAGHNIAAGQVVSTLAPAGGTGNASISAQNFTATSALTGVAKTDAEIIATSARTMHSDVTLQATREARIVANGANSSLTIMGDTRISTDLDVAAGSSGTAGLAAFYALDGGSLTAQGDLYMSANATGADSSTAGVAGGNATGGSVRLQGQAGGNVDVWGTAYLNANGSGGQAQSSGVNAGSGTGGSIQATTFDANSSLDIGGNIFASADGYGGYAGCTGCDGLGGAGNGGTLYVGPSSGADNSTVTLGNFESIFFFSATGSGGASSGGVAGATGTGGTVFVQSLGLNSVLDLQGDLNVSALGYGGEAAGSNVNGGLGDGGNVYVQAAAGGAEVIVRGTTDISADGYGGNSGGEGCFVCLGAGGTGLGGEVQLSTGASAPGASLTLEGAVTASATGHGGDGVAAGGLGDGGLVASTFAAATSINYQSSLFLLALGRGGDSADSNGGTGLGGQVKVGSQTGATGGSLTVTGSADVNVEGFGGDAFGSGNGGVGQGGITDNGGSAGTVSFLDRFVGYARGTGGDSVTGTGGEGRGGSGWVDAFGATVTIGGYYYMDVGAQGGSGAVGGAALGGGAAGNPGGAYLASSSSLNVTGTATVISNATGGAGSGGVGGAATGGFATIRATNNGNLAVVGDATVEALAFGGTGTTLGGNAYGGFAAISANTGGDVDLLALTRVSSDATAFNSGDGYGGTSRLFAGAGSTVDLNQLNLRADGRGGDDTGQEAGDGYGGTATLEANGAGASITVANNVTTGTVQDREMISADGFGGTTFGNGDPYGGDGTGGTVNLRSTGGAMVSIVNSATATAPILIRARGYGGDGDAHGTTGGDGIGGIHSIVVDNSAMTLGVVQLSSFGEGGGSLNFAETFNVTGGNGSGGQRHISVLNGGVLTAAFAGGLAGGLGGNGSGSGNGGDGSGGLATLTVTNATLNVTGNSTIYSSSGGGEALGTGNGGHSLGGAVTNVNITNATINIAAGATLGFDSLGFGGGSVFGAGGNALGGTVNATITNSAINGGLLSATALGQAGSGVTGGGDGTAGAASLTLNAATLNLQDLRIRAQGFGGFAEFGAAGDGIGGSAQINASAGTSTITLSGLPLEVLANGQAGSITGSGGTAGNGTGGFAQIFAASGATLTVNAATSVDARGLGGNSAGSGSGGIGDGGTAALYTNGGTLNLNGNATLLASGIGGNATAGTGGDGLGGSARVGTDAGLVSISGGLILDGSATGGNGLSGGNAVALLSLPDESGPVAAAIYAGNGGAVNVAGATAINASATGGNGSNGNGGDATAGETDIVAFVGDITLASLALNANGTGGAGGLGGNGGFGAGGAVDVAFGLNAAPVDGVITIASADIDANGTGGAGGAGVDANSGGDGGAGGAGTGGEIFFIGSAAGGSLQSGNVTLNAQGAGGAGGAGGNGDSGAGGNGGAGGTATGGYVLAGTLSNSGSPGTGGDFDVANISIDSSAIGGSGGNGGTGGGGTGTGGNGGNAIGGGANLLIRGVAASADAVTLLANATGGDGGTGLAAGNGGNATTGLVSVEAKDRFDHPTQRGSLVADSITATAVATGGAGAIAGTETVFGGSFFRILNGDATIGSVSFTIAGDLYDDSFYSDYVSVRDGTATIGSFSYDTTGALALDASNGTMNATTIALTAGTFRDILSDVPPPTAPGTYSADSISITTGGDFITNANLDSGSDITLMVPGLIQAADITAADNVTVHAVGALSVGDVTSSGGNVDIRTSTAILAGDVTAAGTVFSRNSGASTFGALTAGDDVDVGSIGALAFASATAGETVRIGSDASITGGAVTAGDSIVATTFGTIQLGALSAGIVNASTNTGALYEVALVGGDINVGTIDAAGDVQLAGFNGIVAGDVTTSDRMFAVSNGNISLGNVAIGDYLQIGGWGLFEYTGVLHVDNTFDARPTFDNFGLGSAASVTTGTIDSGRIEIDAVGDITTGAVDSTSSTRMISSGGYVLVNGGIDSLGFISLLGSTVTTGALTSQSNIYISSPGAVSTGPLDSGLWIEISGGSVAVNGTIDAATYVDLESVGDISFGDANAQEFTFSAGGAVTGGNIVATTHIVGEAGGAIILGNLTVSGAPTENDFSLGLVSGTSIQVGDVSVFDSAGFATTGTLTTGDIYAGNLIMALVSGDIVTGALTTDSGGQIYIADSSMFETGGGLDNFDGTIVLALDPVATGGSLTIDGAIDTPLFRAAIGDAFSIGDISVQGAFAVQATSITTGDISATGFIDLTAIGAIVTGDLFAGTSITLDGGSVTTGDIQAGLGAAVVGQGFTTLDVGSGNAVEIFSGSSILTGDITTDGYVGLYAADDITAGSITAEHDVIALAGGNASFGAITTPERFILAGYGNFGQLNDGQTFDPALIFGLFPIESTGGNATFAGSSSALQFEAYVGGNTDVESITANPDLGDSPVLGTGGYIRIDTGGTLAIAGQVSADYIDFVSRDININPQAQIVTGQGITFNSINPDGTYVGDNLTGTNGYRLSQAELDRVDSPFYGFNVLPGRGAAPMMLVGDFSLDLSGGPHDEGAYFEIDSDGLGETEDELLGIIRIVGDVSLTSSTDKTVYLTAKTVTLDAATGSLSLTDGSGALNGLIEFEANNIFVASGAIIDKLLVDPRYPGHVAELNAPAAVQRPGGVLRAGAIDFNDEAALQNLLVQNTGTAATPAGFVVLSESAYYDGVEDGDHEDLPPPASINLVINGQIVTPTGILTGAAVRDALVVEYGSTEPFTANSTINGCPLTGSCGGVVVPPAAVITPTQVAILTSDPLGESFFGNEVEIGDNSTDDGSSTSPINAPQPLFDTRPLNSDEDVNEPISGAGNPSLYGIISDEDDDDEEEDEEEKKKKKGEAKPAGQANVRSGDGK